MERDRDRSHISKVERSAKHTGRVPEAVVTTKIYDRTTGGAEHCQMGAQALWHADFFDWLAAKFGDGA